MDGQRQIHSEGERRRKDQVICMVTIASSSLHLEWLTLTSPLTILSASSITEPTACEERKQEVCELYSHVGIGRGEEVQ